MPVMIHELKTHPAPFWASWERRKPFECRLDDRAFKEGDGVILREYDPESLAYSGREIIGWVGYVLGDGRYGIAHGYVVFGVLEPCNVTRHVPKKAGDSEDLRTAFPARDGTPPPRDECNGTRSDP